MQITFSVRMSLYSYLTAYLIAVQIIAAANKKIGGHNSLWDLHIGRKVLHSFAYLGRDVSVWMDKETENLGTSEKHFYVTPIAELLPDSSRCEYNSLTESYKISYKVKLWDKQLEDECVRHLKLINYEVNSNQVHPLPFYQLRSVWVSAQSPKNFELDSNWRTNFQQRYVVTFFAHSTDNETCTRLKNVISSQPYQFVDSVNLEYSLSAGLSASKVISIRTEHVTSSSMYADLMNMNVNENNHPTPYRYITGKDLQKFVITITDNVIASETVSGEFVDRSDHVSLKQLITHSLDVQKFNMQNFSRQSWESVYWQPEYARPDKLSTILNKNLNISIVNDTVIQKNTTAENGNAILNVINMFDLTGAGSSNRVITVDQLKNFLKRNEYEVELKGEMIVPKNLEIYRLNLHNLQDNHEISTKLVQIHRTDASDFLDLTVGATEKNTVEENNLLKNRLTEFENRLDRYFQDSEISMSDKVKMNDQKIGDFMETYSSLFNGKIEELSTNLEIYRSENSKNLGIMKKQNFNNCQICVVRWDKPWYKSSYAIQDSLCQNFDVTKMADLDFYTTGRMQIQINCTVV